MSDLNRRDEVNRQNNVDRRSTSGVGLMAGIAIALMLGLGFFFFSGSGTNTAGMGDSQNTATSVPTSSPSGMNNRAAPTAPAGNASGAGTTGSGAAR